ncbi:myb-related transcription factor, partner of profilin-like [Dreissena polymorpha]|nr:myb-related transcription factor, partner of profilin-like [Dreissena polymorpha]
MESEKNQRAKNWSHGEIAALAGAIEKHYTSLFGRFSQNLTSKDKSSLWKMIAEEVNAVGGWSRKDEDCQRKWTDLKSVVKKKGTEKACSMQRTGGGPPETDISLKPIQEKILSMIPPVLINGVGGVDTFVEMSSSSSPSAKDMDVAVSYQVKPQPLCKETAGHASTGLQESATATTSSRTKPTTPKKSSKTQKVSDLMFETEFLHVNES